MSVYQTQSALPLALHNSTTLRTAGVTKCAPEQQSVRPTLTTRIIGCWRRVHRSLAHTDACDMTPERALSYQQAFDRATINFDMEDAATRQIVLKSCIPLLFNMRVLSMQMQYARKLAELTPTIVGNSEQFTLQLLACIEAYGAGMPLIKILQTASL